MPTKGRPAVFNPLTARTDGAKAWRKRQDPAQLQAALDAALERKGWDLATRRKYMVRFVWGWSEAKHAQLARQAKRPAVQRSWQGAPV